MRGKIQQRPSHLLLPRWQELYPAAEWMPQEASFHDALLDCAKQPIVDQTERQVAAPSPHPAATALKRKRTTVSMMKRAWSWLQAKNAAAAAGRQWQTAQAVSIKGDLDPRAKPNQVPRLSSSSLLARGWSWLQEKSGTAPTKRLRVADFTALGEKRFVALVKVEGCEFLIGGGASGVSLLTKLEPSQQEASELRRE